jgi:deoxyribodipyrimidine photo-lyase
MAAAPYHFPTDHESVLKRIAQIDPEEYGKSRNFIRGAVTYLSPYISRGFISTRFVLESVLKNGWRMDQSEKLIQELLWRDYFQRVYQHLGENILQDIHQAQLLPVENELPAAVIKANTGITAIDKGIENLYQQGYVHNHIRMYIASIVCNFGKTHWLPASRWMYYHLLDADIASNTCSWQWVCGSFGSKKYFANQENINKYGGTNQADTFLDRSYEELATFDMPQVLNERSVWTGQTELPSVNSPTIDISKKTLLYNSYQLDPDWHSGENINRLLLLEPQHFNDFPISVNSLEFILRLSENIPGIQLLVLNAKDLQTTYPGAQFISKEHPLTRHYLGEKESRDWIVPEVIEFYPSFFKYWKACRKRLF